MVEPKTAVDWLRFRTRAEVLPAFDALRPLFGRLAENLNLQPLDRGKDGFQQACAIRIEDMPIGRMDYGGASQRGWVRVNITGAGCEWVQRWDAIDGVEALAEAEIKRLDVALTTWKGEVTHEGIKASHTAGHFTCGGRPPDMQTIENSNERAGRTCYVGNRKSSDKFFRGYEKGFELAGKMGPLGATCTQINGFPLEDIYRCEVEFKDETRPIPWEVIDRRDEYFAGSYPALAQLLPGVESDILMRRPDRQPQVDLAAALANIRVQYGATLFTALTCYGGDFLRVWDQVVGSAHNPNLLAAGVLLVDHE